MMAKRGLTRQREFLRRRGRDALWQQSILYPAQTSDGVQEYGSFDAQSRSYQYEPAVNYSGRNRAIMFTSDGRNTEFDFNGSLVDGRCTGTVRPDIPVGNQDRIILKETVRVDSVEVTRAASGQVDTLDLRFVQEVLLVRGPAGSYVVGRDVELLPDNTTGNCRLEWQTGVTTPAAGTRYFVNVYAWPVWIVTGQPMRRGYEPGDRNQGPWRCDLVLDDERMRAV